MRRAEDLLEKTRQKIDELKEKKQAQFKKSEKALNDLLS